MKTGKNADGVRIDRGTKWGNPFIIGKDGDRNTVITKYAKHLKSQIDRGEVTEQDLQSLKNKDFKCWCAPQACHGQILMKAVNSVPDPAPTAECII